MLVDFWCAISLILLVAFLRSAWFKGATGEAFVKLLARLWLSSRIYHPIHNVTLPTLDGTTQIDHIFVSRFGIFVIETKNMKGWIFGSEYQAQWTQTIFKKSYKFQNPLRQNHKHVKAVESLVDVPSETIKSVIVFTGGSKFKSPMPKNVTHGIGYVTYIRSFREKVLSESQVKDVLGQISQSKLLPTLKTSREHVRNLKSRNEPSSEQRCPRCGARMVLRTASRGKNAGKKFWGCSNYPACKAVKNLS